MDVYGLIGNPVGHSLSPPMHEAAYDALEMDARYVTFEPAESAIEPSIRGAEALGISGINVTIPFKEVILEYVDPDPMARRIGAVNTVNFATDPPTGLNTDAVGARRALVRHGVELAGATVVVVGAGGAARAIVAMLDDAGADRIAIANRTESRAVELASLAKCATGHGLDAVAELVTKGNLLINATSVGMEEDRSPVPRSALHADLCVMDIVYRPIETTLLEEAAAAGATTIDGAWMLLYQGVEAFERWTGREAPVTEMNTALRDRL